MPTWYERYPVARFDKTHLAQVTGCSDIGDGGGMESLGVSTQTVGDCLQKLQPGLYAPLSYLNARLDPHVVLNVAFLFWPSYLNSTPHRVCIGHTCI